MRNAVDGADISLVIVHVAGIRPIVNHDTIGRGVFANSLRPIGLNNSPQHVVVADHDVPGLLKACRYQVLYVKLLVDDAAPALGESAEEVRCLQICKRKGVL